MVEQIINKVKEIGNRFWRGEVKDRKKAFLELHNFLNTLYNRNIKLIFNINEDPSKWTFSGNSYYSSLEEKIVLKGKLSLITFLHEWGHALGKWKQEEAQEYAVSIFSKAFPEKFAKLQRDGYLCLIPTNSP